MLWTKRLEARRWRPSPQLSFVLLALASACHKTRTFSLPNRPTSASLAFVVLYDGNALKDIGPVVPYQRIYAGSYSLENDGTGLDARLFFVDDADLQKRALEACLELPERIRQIACANRVGDCPADPASCLGVTARGSG